MADSTPGPPSYRRYRAGRGAGAPTRKPQAASDSAPAAEGRAWRRGDYRAGRWRHPGGQRTRGGRLAGLRQRLTIKRVLLGLVGLVVCWFALSLGLFLVSSHFERVSPPADVEQALDAGGFMLTSANNILVLGSDRRPKGSREPDANTSGPSNSDVMMLIRTGDGHAARLSIPRDTVIEIPGHGMQKINAAYAFGGPALAISVVKSYLGIPINHVVEVNFENFPQLIDAMGGVTYTGGCIVSKLDGGSANGGYTLRLPAGTHHLDGKQALALARTRKNLCEPDETDIQREEHQQALFNDMKSRLMSPSSFLRMPLIAWNAPPAIISDMSGVELLGLFAALTVGGTPATHVLYPTGQVVLPSGEEGLTVSEGARRAAVARFMAG